VSDPDSALAIWIVITLIFVLLGTLVIRDCVRYSRRNRERHSAPWYAFQDGGPGDRWTPWA
jgi:hypothetical protein